MDIVQFLFGIFGGFSSVIFSRELAVTLFLIVLCYRKCNCSVPLLVSSVPNGVGSAAGATQLILYFIYREKKGGASANPTTEEEYEEIGASKSSQDDQSNATAGFEGQGSAYTAC